jgi:hypothetical protein
LTTTVCDSFFRSNPYLKRYIGIRALPQNSIRTFNFSEFNNVAVLNYEGAPDANPAVDPDVNPPMLNLPLFETNLHVRFSRFVRLIYPLTRLIYSYVQPLVPTPVVRFLPIVLFILPSRSKPFVIQPGKPVPGGADINIDLNVIIVSKPSLGCR